MSTHIYKNGPRESGSVIWFILLAIALTAALTMTLTRSSDTGGGTGDVERARVQASEIMRYAKGIDAAIDQMAIRGIGEGQISFENTVVPGYNTNTRCTDASCQVFGDGGQTYMVPRDEWLDIDREALGLYGQWYFTGNVCVEGVGTGGANCDTDGASSNEDLVIILPWVKQEICAQLNSLLGVPAPIPMDAGAGWAAGNPLFNGLYADGAAINQGGRESGCFEGSGGAQPGGSFSYYHVLIDR